MKNNTALQVLIYSLLAVVVGIAFQMLFVNEPIDQQKNNFPWEIDINTNNQVSVFGLTLGKSTMGDGLNRFQVDTEVSLFLAEDNSYAVEAFFKDINMGGLAARIVLTAELTDSQLEEMYERGSRISTLGSGTRKVTLSYDDLDIARNAAIRSITYLPKANLDDAIILKRFGEPEKKIKETKGDAIHWLYPSRGLDITISEESKEVLQFTSPEYFQKLLAPLLQQQAD